MTPMASIKVRTTELLRWLRCDDIRPASNSRAAGATHKESPAPAASAVGSTAEGATAKGTGTGETAADSAQSADGAGVADGQTGANIAAGFRVAGVVAGQATLVTALLYYFGWVRAQAVLGYFGVNAECGAVGR
jgi:hypothetical protein